MCPSNLQKFIRRFGFRKYTYARVPGTGKNALILKPVLVKGNENFVCVLLALSTPFKIKRVHSCTSTNTRKSVSH